MRNKDSSGPGEPDFYLARIGDSSFVRQGHPKHMHHLLHATPPALTRAMLWHLEVIWQQGVASRRIFLRKESKTRLILG